MNHHQDDENAVGSDLLLLHAQGLGSLDGGKCVEQRIEIKDGTDLSMWFQC